MVCCPRGISVIGGAATYADNSVTTRSDTKGGQSCRTQSEWGARGTNLIVVSCGTVTAFGETTGGNSICCSTLERYKLFYGRAVGASFIDVKLYIGRFPTRAAIVDSSGTRTMPGLSEPVCWGLVGADGHRSCIDDSRANTHIGVVYNN